MKKINIVDLFCGGGGESTGMISAADSLGFDVSLLAINHWELAVETHARNHPTAQHLCESIQSVDPVKAVPGGRVDLLWASPECTHHSVARGGRPCSDQSRASAWLILKWLQELYIDRVIIENVPEFIQWGPIGANGRPIEARKGETFTAWCASLKSLGYRVDYRILRAADYGVPTTRRRLFVQAVRGRKKIVWPEPTHSEIPSLFGTLPWIPARDIIDWGVESRSILHRSKPLADATLSRIEAGIRRYWGKWAEPFLVVLRGTGTSQKLDRPLPTITAGGLNYGIVEPFIIPQQSKGAPRSVSFPAPTVATKGAIGIVEPFIVQYYGNGDARSVLQPLDTVTTKDRFALISAGLAELDIRFRMLQPHELAAAQGFPSGYWFSGNKADQIKQIGNAVPCGLAEAISREMLVA